MEGPGKYDDLCTYVREQSQAVAVLLIVIGGNQGNGFSVQAIKNIASELPLLLRTTADRIEMDLPQI